MSNNIVWENTRYLSVQVIGNSRTLIGTHPTKEQVIAEVELLRKQFPENTYEAAMQKDLAGEEAEIVQARMIQNTNPNYWHYFVVTDDQTYFSPMFFCIEDAFKCRKDCSEANPDCEFKVVHGLALARTLRGYDLPLDQIASPYQREFIRLHRERIAAMEVSDHA